MAWIFIRGSYLCFNVVLHKGPHRRFFPVRSGVNYPRLVGEENGGVASLIFFWFKVSR